MNDGKRALRAIERKRNDERELHAFVWFENVTEMQHPKRIGCRGLRGAGEHTGRTRRDRLAVVHRRFPARHGLGTRDDASDRRIGAIPGDDGVTPLVECRFDIAGFLGTP